jgi:small subunit ribosomal protein S9
MEIDTTKSNLLALAIGRRKEATAIVQIYPLKSNEKSEILINNCLAEVFLQFNAAYLNTLNRSLALLDLKNNYRIIIKTRGGGLTGQTGAIQLGLARALCKIDPNYRATLKLAGLLTRDSRKVERKKYGLKKARKASQYSKR